MVIARGRASLGFPVAPLRAIAPKKSGIADRGNPAFQVIRFKR
jgi:hypothetical protein